MNKVDGTQPKLVALKDVLPPHPASLNRRRYVKLKEPIFRNGAKVYWKEVSFASQEEEHRPGVDEEDYAASAACFSILYFIRHSIAGTL
ncbi:unnamed protein product [Linum trigynum]|uniref:Uncharacterized protein n=1 Tax=Linum trigynum TaxID=586398 RepID=A0AAV2CG13_9ROSI